MRRWLLVGSTLILLLVVYYAVWLVRAKLVERQHEAYYKATLNSYNQVLPIGVSRGEVEAVLRSRHVSFLTFCCVDQEYTNTDIAKIGEEAKPWYCSEYNVYVEFQFSSGTNGFAPGDPSDRLKKIAIMRKLERCL
jgi:hypothetical protein